MRALIVLAGVVPVLAGCGGASEEQHDANAAAVRYQPPTVTSRLDFGGQIERRFHRLDKDGNDKLSGTEVPDRMRAAVSRFDKDGDGALNSDEWGALMLERFDQRDLNKDGTVTTEERDAMRARGVGGRAS
jgi:hypothetical protein